MEHKMNIYQELRNKKHLTQVELSKKLNVNQATISKWEKGKSIPDIMMLKTLSDFYGVSIEYLLSNGGSLEKKSEKQSTHIPVLGCIPAGIPIEMIEDIIDYEDISPAMLVGGKEYFALKVKGDSMYPKFIEGDILIIKKQEDCNSGDFCIVAVNGYDATLKKVIKKESSIILMPLNPNYEPMIYDNEQIKNLPVKILGVVVEIRRTI